MTDYPLQQQSSLVNRRLIIDPEPRIQSTGKNISFVGVIFRSFIKPAQKNFQKKLRKTHFWRLNVRNRNREKVKLLGVL